MAPYNNAFVLHLNLREHSIQAHSRFKSIRHFAPRPTELPFYGFKTIFSSVAASTAFRENGIG